MTAPPPAAAPRPADPLLATSDIEEAKVAEVLADLQSKGQRPYFVPVGGSSGIGVFGYVTGTGELVDQLRDIGERPSRLYYASGSRGTQAGLTLGAKVHGAPYAVYGIAVSGGESFKKERALRIANEAATIAALDTRVTEGDLHTDQRYIGPGYGIATPECLEAIRMLATTEAILLDPVYTAKAMAGLIDHVRRREVDPGSSIVFLHTGGVPALFSDRWPGTGGQ